LNSETATENLAGTILQITAQKKPETVDQLVELVREAYPISNDEILRAIIKLQNEGKLSLIRSIARVPQPTGILSHLRTNAALWFWATIILSIVTLVAVFTIPETAFPVVYVRYVLGAVFVLWLPGYAFTRALFLRQLPIKTSDKDMDVVDRIALSIGMSLALVSIVGLLLNFTPWGIRPTPIVLSLLALTVTLATIGVLREHQLRTPRRSQGQ
jgi:hypothetical protein